MKSATDKAFLHTLRKILMIQIGLVLFTATMVSYLKGYELFWATLYGGAIIITSTSFFGWRLRIATQINETGSTINSVELFKSLFLRFVLVIVLLALGLGWLKMSALGMMFGFIVAQLAFWFSRSSYGITRRN